VSHGSHENGFTLVSALFLLVVLAFAGTIMVSLGAVQRRTTDFALQGARAYHAAQSGIEWGVYQALNTGACPAPTSFPLSEGGLIGFGVDVSCSSTGHDEAGSIANVYQIVSVAEYGSFGDRDYVRRRLRVVLTDAP
jgi:MSHA biogenesis protein MshP